MEPELRDALAEAVRLWARPTTPEDLAARGARVRSIQLKLLPELIEKAVNRTLIARTLSEGEDDRDLGRMASEEFMRLLRQQPAHREEQEDGASLSTLERIKRRLDQERTQLLEEEAALRAREGAYPLDHDPMALEARLRRMIARGEGGGSRAGEVLEVVRQLVEAERHRVQHKELERRRLEMQRLERRLEKVCRQLEESEAALKRLLALSQRDPGLKSIHREVQGLDLDDSQFVMKSAWLEKIFKENRR